MSLTQRSPCPEATPGFFLGISKSSQWKVEGHEQAHHASLTLELQWWWGHLLSPEPSPISEGPCPALPMVRGSPGLQPPEAVPPALAAREGTGWVWVEP